MKTLPLFHRQLLAGLALMLLASISFAGPALADGPESGEPSVTDPYIRSLVPKGFGTDAAQVSVTDPYIRSLVPKGFGTDAAQVSVTDPYIRSLVPKDVAVITVPERVTVPTGGRSGWGEEIAAGLGGLLIGALLTAAGAYFITYRRGVSTA